MIRAARSAGIPFAWFTADEEFGQNPGLCDYLETSRILLSVSPAANWDDLAGSDGA